MPLNHNETIFNNYLVEPNLKAVCNAIDDSKFNWAKVGFFDGEEELVSMTKQLKRKGSFVNHRFIYKADGVVRLQEAHDIEICKENLKKFRVDITLVHGKAPEHLDEFADPDAIFIGGTSGAMGPLLDVCCQRLKRNGRIVINAVTIETLAQAVEGLKQRGFQVDVTLAQISRSKPILELTRFDALNPIYIITAKREGDE